MPDGLHDLRRTGAMLKELMARLGHSNVCAAVTYQHATRDRDQAIGGPCDMTTHDAQSGSSKRDTHA